MINVMYGEDGNHTRTFTFQTPLAESGFVKIKKKTVKLNGKVLKLL